MRYHSHVLHLGEIWVHLLQQPSNIKGKEIYLLNEGQGCISLTPTVTPT
jgi:hypothetical protein